MSKSILTSSKSRHMKIKHHYVRSQVAEGEVKLVPCPTTDMVADILTKNLERPQFEKLRDILLGKAPGLYQALSSQLVLSCIYLSILRHLSFRICFYFRLINFIYTVLFFMHDSTFVRGGVLYTPQVEGECQLSPIGCTTHVRLVLTCFVLQQCVVCGDALSQRTHTPEHQKMYCMYAVST